MIETAFYIVVIGVLALVIILLLIEWVEGLHRRRHERQRAERIRQTLGTTRLKSGRVSAKRRAF